MDKPRGSVLLNVSVFPLQSPGSVSCRQRGVRVPHSPVRAEGSYGCTACGAAPPTHIFHIFMLVPGNFV